MATEGRRRPSPHVERPGPAEFRDPLIRREMAKAAVWFGMALLIVGVIVLAQPLLLIIGGVVFAVFLDGGTRLLGRILPIGAAGGCCSSSCRLRLPRLGLLFRRDDHRRPVRGLAVVVAAQFDRLLEFGPRSA